MESGCEDAGVRVDCKDVDMARMTVSVDVDGEIEGCGIGMMPVERLRSYRSTLVPGVINYRKMSALRPNYVAALDMLEGLAASIAMVVKTRSSERAHKSETRLSYRVSA
jgi:hypothetical protein